MKFFDSLIRPKLELRRFPRLYELVSDSNVSILDVGGRGGLVPALSGLEGFSELWVVEPEPLEAARLIQKSRQDGKHVNVITEGLWKTEGKRKLYVTKNPGLTSVLRPNTALFDSYAEHGVSEIVETHDIQVSTLNDIFEKYNFSPTVIKLDTQGSELEILESAGELSTCEAIYVEAEFLEFYHGQHLFGDLYQHLNANGFELKDLKRTFHRRRIQDIRMPISRSEITWCHALFLKNPAYSIDLLKNAVCNFGFGFYDSFWNCLMAERAVSVELKREIFAWSKRVATYQNLRFLKNKLNRFSHPDTDWRAKSDSGFY